MTDHPLVFISHASEDKYFVPLLVDILEHHGISTWYDDHNLNPGDKLSKNINKALKKVNYFIIVVSKHSEQSRWVKAEMTSFIKNTPKSLIIPITLEHFDISKSKHPELKDLKYIEFKPCMKTGFEMLLKTFDQDYSINSRDSLIKQITQRTEKIQRTIHDRRIGNTLTRVRHDCWNAFSDYKAVDEFEKLALDNDDEMGITNALHNQLKKYKFIKKGHIPEDSKIVIDSITHEVVKKMRNEKNFSAIRTINGIADEICKKFDIEFFDRRKIHDRRNPVIEQRTSNRHPCNNITLKIAFGSKETAKIKVKNVSKNGICFYSSKILNKEEFIRVLTSKTTDIPLKLANKYSIKYSSKEGNGFFYGAQVAA